MTKRKQRSATQWQSLFVEHEQSNLTASEFCRQHNINPSHFSTRKRQFRVKDNIQLDQRSFIKLTPPHNPLSSSAEKDMVLIHQHTQLQLPSKVDAQWLAQLILALS